jgi:hypothetical protein
VARQVPGFVSEDPKVLRVVFKRAIDARVADTRFVLDRLAALERGRRPDGSQRRPPAGLRGALDLSRVGMFGYSYGGYTAGEAMVYDRRIDAGVNLDGTMAHGFDVSPDWPYAPGEVVKRGLDRPFLLFGSTGHNHLGSEGFPYQRSELAAVLGQPARLEARLDAAQRRARELRRPPGRRASDRPRTGLPPATFEPLIGTIDPDRSIGAQRAYIASFFDLHLRGRDNHLLDGPSAAFPEIEFVR